MKSLIACFARLRVCSTLFSAAGNTLNSNETHKNTEKHCRKKESFRNPQRLLPPALPHRFCHTHPKTFPASQSEIKIKNVAVHSPSTFFYDLPRYFYCWGGRGMPFLPLSSSASGERLRSAASASTSGMAISTISSLCLCAFV